MSKLGRARCVCCSSRSSYYCSTSEFGERENSSERGGLPTLRPRSVGAQPQLACGDIPVEVFYVKFRPQQVKPRRLLKSIPPPRQPRNNHRAHHPEPFSCASVGSARSVGSMQLEVYVVLHTNVRQTGRRMTDRCCGGGGGSPTQDRHLWGAARPEQAGVGGVVGLCVAGAGWRDDTISDGGGGDDDGDVNQWLSIEVGPVAIVSGGGHLAKEYTYFTSSSVPYLVGRKACVYACLSLSLLCLFFSVSVEPDRTGARCFLPAACLPALQQAVSVVVSQSVKNIENNGIRFMSTFFTMM